METFLRLMPGFLRSRHIWRFFLFFKILCLSFPAQGTNKNNFYYSGRRAEIRIFPRNSVSKRIFSFMFCINFFSASSLYSKKLTLHKILNSFVTKFSDNEYITYFFHASVGQYFSITIRRCRNIFSNCRNRKLITSQRENVTHHLKPIRPSK